MKEKSLLRDRMRGLETVVGLAAIGSIVIGIAGFIAALFAVIAGDFVGVGCSLIASSLSYGLLTAAVLAR